MKPNSLFKGKHTKKALFIFVPIILCIIIVCILLVSLNDRSPQTEKIADSGIPDILSDERGEEADMEKLYDRINFENAPSTKTPLNEENLNKMDAGINALDDRVIDLNETKINKNGTDEVTFRNIKGIENVGNIASEAEMLREGYYPVNRGGKLDFIAGSFNTYIIPCEVSKYVVDWCRFWCVVGNDKETIIGNLNSNEPSGDGTVIDVTSEGYLVYCVTKAATDRGLLVLNKGEIRETEEIWKLPKFFEENVIAVQNANTTEEVLNFQTSVKKGVVLTYNASFDTFTSLKIGFSSDSTWATNYLYYFEITSDSVNWHRNGQVDITEQHNLTIGDFIGVHIFDDGNHSWSIEIVSVGGSYTHKFEGAQNGYCVPFAVFTGTNLANNKLALTFKDLNKNIYMFGDSFFSLVPERWLYYLSYKDNCLIDGYSGGRGYIIIEDFKNLVTIGKPKYAIWCLGMNDLGDVDGVLSSRWLTSVNEFLNVCSKNNIIPILATIPSVPTLNHEKKNEWVRNSGYRYIDFAKAVGAQADGTWYDGLLSSDGVHPTVEGAKALYGRAIADFPEFAIE